MVGDAWWARRGGSEGEGRVRCEMEMEMEMEMIAGKKDMEMSMSISMSMYIHIVRALPLRCKRAVVSSPFSSSPSRYHPPIHTFAIALSTFQMLGLISF